MLHLFITTRATLTKPVSCGSLSVSLWASWLWLLQCKLYWCADSADIDLRGLVVTTPPLPVNPIPALSPPSRDRSCPPNPRRLLETCLSPLARFLRRRLLWRKVTSVPLWKGKKTPKDKVFKHFFFLALVNKRGGCVLMNIRRPSVGKSLVLAFHFHRLFGRLCGRHLSNFA